MGKKKPPITNEVIERQVYTVEEYCIVLNLSMETVLKRMRLKMIPGEKKEGRWEIRRPEVAMYLEGRWSPKDEGVQAA